MRASRQRPEPLVMVLAGPTTVERLCQLSTGAAIAPNLVVPYLSTAHVQTIVFDDGGQPIRATGERTFRGRLRRAIQARDQHCQHPSGCDAPLEQCDVDHVVPWAQTRDTSVANGRLLCATHNRHAELRDLRPRPRTRPPDGDAPGAAPDDRYLRLHLPGSPDGSSTADPDADRWELDWGKVDGWDDGPEADGREVDGWDDEPDAGQWEAEGCGDEGLRTELERLTRLRVDALERSA